MRDLRKEKEVANNAQAPKGVLRNKKDFKERAWVDALSE